MKTIALIPARYDASRFPGKMLAMLFDKPVIRLTYEAVETTGLFDDVAVVTDSPLIYEAVGSFGGKVVMSKKEHECGSDRIAEVAADTDADIIVNVQGDEPFIRRQPLADLLSVFKTAESEKIDLASLMHPIHLSEHIDDPNRVKVVVDKDNFALLFSRSAIPYARNKDIIPVYYNHIGVYAFRRDVLAEFTGMPVGILESTEKLEQLRYLENGKKIKMVITEFIGQGIDTPEDLERAKNILKKLNK